MYLIKYLVITQNLQQYVNRIISRRFPVRSTAPYTICIPCVHGYSNKISESSRCDSGLENFVEMF